MWHGSFIGVSLALVCWALWDRRRTWGCRWATPITLSLALQGLALLLLTPVASASLGGWLYQHTGHWSLEDYFGHVCWLLAITALMYSALSRLGTDELFCRKFNQMAVLPLTVAIPTMMGLLWVSSASREYTPDILDAPVDLPMAAYWVLLCGMSMHLLTYTWRALMVLRRSPRHRPLATAYLLVCDLGILTAVIQVLAVAVPALNTPVTTTVLWITTTGMAVVCALIAQQSVSASAGRRREHPGPTASSPAGPSASS